MSLEELMSVQGKGDVVDESRDCESEDDVSHVVKDAVLAVCDKDVTYEVESDVLEGT